MSTFSGVVRILGVVVPRLPRFGFVMLQTKSRLNSGQRKAAAAFEQTLLAQGVPAELAAALTKEYPHVRISDFVGGRWANRRPHLPAGSVRE